MDPLGQKETVLIGTINLLQSIVWMYFFIFIGTSVFLPIKVYEKLSSEPLNLPMDGLDLNCLDLNCLIQSKPLCWRGAGP